VERIEAGTCPAVAPGNRLAPRRLSCRDVGLNDRLQYPPFAVGQFLWHVRKSSHERVTRPEDRAPGLPPRRQTEPPSGVSLTRPSFLAHPCSTHMVRFCSGTRIRSTPDRSGDQYRSSSSSCSSFSDSPRRSGPPPPRWRGARLRTREVPSAFALDAAVGRGPSPMNGAHASSPRCARRENPARGVRDLVVFESCSRSRALAMRYSAATRSSGSVCTVREWSTCQWGADSTVSEYKERCSARVQAQRRDRPASREPGWRAIIDQVNRDLSNPRAGACPPQPEPVPPCGSGASMRGPGIERLTPSETRLIPSAPLGVGRSDIIGIGLDGDLAPRAMARSEPMARRIRPALRAPRDSVFRRRSRPCRRQ
jgi:hypothetical protein